MEKYLKTWTENMRKQLGLPPKEDPQITNEEWEKMSPKEKIKFIRDRRNEQMGRKRVESEEEEK